MIYGFVKQSGGHVKIYSEVGLGTMVRLFLPQTEAESERPSAAQPAEETICGGRETVLVVEDDQMVRSYIVAQLRSLDYEVIEAPHGPAGLEALAANPGINLVISDMVMPKGMSGLDLAREAWRRYPGLKVLLTSGYNEATFVHPSEPAVELLAKPFGKDLLARKVRAILERA